MIALVASQTSTYSSPKYEIFLDVLVGGHHVLSIHIAVLLNPGVPLTGGVMKYPHAGYIPFAYFAGHGLFLAQIPPLYGSG